MQPSRRHQCGAAGQAASGIDKVHAVIGGFHIVPPLGDDYIRDTIAEFREIDPDFIIPATAPAIASTIWPAMRWATR